MDSKTIREVAWLGEEFVKGRAIKGVVLFFHGLGRIEMKFEPTMQELAFADAGALVVHPYYGAWNWMNRQARAFVDELVSSIYREFKLPDSAPLIITGESMGGQCALLYTRYAARPIAACTVNCPVCDLEFAFSERPDVPRTVHFAFRGYKEDMKTLLQEHSPVAQAANMPDIPYQIIHGVQDTGVAKSKHSDKLVPLLRKKGLNVEYLEVPEMVHCSPMPHAVWKRQTDFVCGHLAK
jgi:dipeptidyl aminopeptidase/acylaminoacyl peptidase